MEPAMPAHTILKLNSVHKTTGYSHCARVGNTLYLAGQVAQDKNGKLVGKGDIEAQAKQVYANLKSILTEAGGTLQHIVKTTTYITHFGSLDGYRKARGLFFTEPFPPNTLLVVQSLASPDFMIEIEAIAELDEKRA
jgi:enamine deaminase RidA (YjgF/YER057c/UK114 family)